MLADVEDLEVYLQREFAGPEANAAAQALEMASGVIRAYTDQNIAPTVEDATLTLHRAASWRIFLPHPPAIPVEVTKVEVDGNELGVDEWKFITSINALDRVAGRWSGEVKITYDHGFADTPPDVMAVVLQAAQRGLTNPQGIQSERLGQYSITYTEGFGGSLVGAGPQLTNVEMKMLDRYRLAGVA